MSWRDFFYFSKGERSALIVLLCLITVAAILLIINNQKKADLAQVAVVKQDTIRNVAMSENKITENKEVIKRETYANYEKKDKPDVIENQKDESATERAERIITTSRNASRSSYPRTDKFEEGTVVELNTADTTILKKVPGIGSAFAARIVKFRDLLGGFYSVNQLAEVYGMDEERFNALKPWFTVDMEHVKKLNVNELTLDELNKHPYIDYRQAKAITQLHKQKGKLTGWDNLKLLDEFSDIDEIRLLPYLSFE
ncbi:MAG: helix-hairpin-helix domain-containing protein [Tannerella sp.]|jgi:DNA uptake protein ComE-like DNA-binding protein|nr:helix-hairpin-helix domain-containing protein [Tannerella sp.]